MWTDRAPARTWVPLLALAFSSLGAGWRGDGSGVAANARLPSAWGASDATWTATLRADGHSSPVVAGGLVYVTEEPLTLVALDLETGEERWRREHPVLDALPSVLRPRVATELAALPQLEHALAEARAGLSEARRDLRRDGPPSDAEARIEAFSDVIHALLLRIEAVAPYAASGPTDFIGTASPTPTADEGGVYVMFGNGVAASWSHTGDLRWRRWLGPPHQPMVGYDHGTAASPLRVDDLVLTAHGRLRGLDARTGEVRWEGPEWPHFGTPVVLRIDGATVVATPGGEVVRAVDGAVLGRGLQPTWYVGPAADNGAVYSAGTVGAPTPRGRRVAASFHLLPDIARDRSPTPGAEPQRVEPRSRKPQPAGPPAVAPATPASVPLQVVERWVRDLSEVLPDDVFAPPLVDDRRVWIVSRHGRLIILDAATGETVHLARLPLSEPARAQVFAGPLRTSDDVLIVDDVGDLLAIRNAPPFDVRRLARLDGPLIATPWVDDARVVVRIGRRVQLYRTGP